MSLEKAILVKLGDYVSKKVKKKFKSNVEFANVCNINESTVRRIMRGEQNITIDILKRICDALGVKMSELLKDLGQ